MAEQRIDWADYAKGLTIILVVYGHAVVGVGKDVAIDPSVYAYAMKPFSQFRMPVFFFVAALFAAFSVRRAWPEFIDRTLLHLVYVFLVWNLLQYGVRLAFSAWANDPIAWSRILLFPIRPINVTWFIWALIWYYAVVRVCRSLAPVLLVAAAAFLATLMAPPHHSPGDVSADSLYALRQSTRHFVYFALGYGGSAWVLGLATVNRQRAVLALTLAYTLLTPLLIHWRLDELPFVDFMNSLLGIAWIAALCMVLAEHRWCGWLRTVGARSLPIFVLHTIVTAGVREIMLRTGLSADPVVLIGMATLLGVVAPMVLASALERLGLPWLFERPSWFRLRAHGDPAAAARSPLRA